MISVLIVSKEKVTFQDIINTLVNNNYKIYWSSSGTEAISLIDEMTIDLLIIDEAMPDITGRQFIEKIVMKNTMINCVVASPLAHEKFHEIYEGLGVLMQFPVMPGRKEAQELLEHMEHIFHLQTK